jgi:hypothetical protein
MFLLLTHPPKEPWKHLPTSNFKTWLDPHPQSQTHTHTHTQTLDLSYYYDPTCPGSQGRVVGIGRSVSSSRNTGEPPGFRGRTGPPATTRPCSLSLSPLPCLARARVRFLDRCPARLLFRSIDRPPCLYVSRPRTCSLCLLVCVYVWRVRVVCSSNWKEFERVIEEEEV